MPHSIVLTRFEAEGLQISQYEIDVEDQDFQYRLDIDKFPEEDVFVLVETGGEIDVEASGLERTDTARAENSFSYEGTGPGEAGLFLRFFNTGKARAIVGKVWRGVQGGAVKVGCKLCKSAVMWLIRTVFAMAGIPFPNPAEDLSGVSTTILNAIDQIKAGTAPAALLNLLGLLPSGIFDAIKYAFHAINWIWDTVDRFIEDVCRRIALCP